MTWIVSLVIAGLMTISSDSTMQPQTTVTQTAAPAPTTQEKTNTQERTDQTYPLNANGKVALNNINGSVTIEGWDKAEARVEVVKIIDCDKPLQIDVKIDSNPNYLRIETDYKKNNSGGRWDGNRCREAKVDYKLTLPRTARLDEIETVNGGINLGGMIDYIKASTVNGRVIAANLRGTIDLSSVNGTLEAAFDSLDNVSQIKMGMVNGKIDLQLPSDADALLKADTVNGAINNDFGLPVRKGEYVGRNLYGKLGDGSIGVKLDGVNGTINIRRRQDGRSPKATTNLLSAAGSNSENNDNDADEDDGANVRAPRPPRAPRVPRTPETPIVPEINVTIPEINLEGGEFMDDKMRAEINRSLADAQKEIAKVNLNNAEIQRQVREGMADARRQMAEARMFSWNNDSARNPMRTRDSKSVAVTGTPSVIINARGGSISIRGWERAEVSYSLAKNSDETKVTLDQKSAEVSLNVVTKPDEPFRLEVYVPRSSNLRVTSDRAIRVEGVKGNLNLDGDDESIDVRDAGGNLSISAADASVRVIGFEGDTQIKTEDGDISLEGDFNSLDTYTADGSTSLTLNESVNALIKSQTKEVIFEGLTVNSDPATDKIYNIWRVGGKSENVKTYNLKTGDGQIVVRGSNRVRVTRSFFLFDNYYGGMLS